MQYHCNTERDGAAWCAEFQVFCRKNPDSSTCWRVVTGGEWLGVIVACVVVVASWFYLVLRFFERMDAEMEAEYADSDSLTDAEFLSWTDDGIVSTLEQHRMQQRGGDY